MQKTRLLILWPWFELLEQLLAPNQCANYSLRQREMVLVGGSVISRQRPPTPKGFTFLIMEDESERVPTALPPTLYEKFARVLREGSLLIEGRLENSPEERRGSDVGRYRSILIDRIWPLEAILQGPRRAQNTVQQVERVVHGAAGHPGQSPRLSASK